MHPLLAPDELLRLLADGTELCVVDVRFSLADPREKEHLYQKAHIPGAHYAHLEKDLSSPHEPGVTGRHPLPTMAQLAAFCSRAGITEETRVVAYDDAGGAFAARLWWLLRVSGHSKVQVLDGGLPAYVALGGTLEESPPLPRGLPLRRLQFEPNAIATIEEVAARSASGKGRLLDARARDRFAGQNETIDRVPGHIPGAKSLPFAENLREGRFRAPSELRARFTEAFAGVPTEEVVFYCGSGVTACHNLLAAEVAGLSGVRLFPGSYSEWIADGTREVEV